MIPVIIHSTLHIYKYITSAQIVTWNSKTRNNQYMRQFQKLHRISSVIREVSIVDSIWKAGLTAPKCALKKTSQKDMRIMLQV